MNNFNEVLAYNLLCSLVTADSQLHFTNVYYQIKDVGVFKEAAYILAVAFENGYRLSDDFKKYEGQISETLKLSDYALHQHDKYFESVRRESAAMDACRDELAEEADLAIREQSLRDYYQEDDTSWV